MQQVLQQELSRRKGQGKASLKSWLRAVEMAELKAVNISNSKIQRCSKFSMCNTERVKPAGGAQSMTREFSPTPSSRPSRWFRYNLAGLAGYDPVQLAEELQPIWAAQEEEVLVTIYNAKVPLLLGAFTAISPAVAWRPSADFQSVQIGCLSCTGARSCPDCG